MAHDAAPSPPSLPMSASPCGAVADSTRLDVQLGTDVWGERSLCGCRLRQLTFFQTKTCRSIHHQPDGHGALCWHMLLIGQFDSPCVRRVGIALKLYGLPFLHEAFSVFRVEAGACTVDDLALPALRELAARCEALPEFIGVRQACNVPR